MKKMTLLLLSAFALVATSYAQPGGGFQRKTVEERVAAVHAKMDSAFKPDAAKLTSIDAVFTSFYKSQDAKMQELMAGGTRPDRETMMAERKKLVDERDEKLKTILTEAELKIWKEQIEPSMMQRPGGGGGGPRNN
jgi:hypothetical protein